MEVKKGFFDSFLNNFLRLIYSKEMKIERYVIFLTIIGFFIRLRAALNLDVLADDMVHISQSAGIISSKILSTHSNPALFFYFNDFMFNLFGYTTLASRLFPLFAGTLLIPLSFLITHHLFKNKKIALFSSFFVTLSTFLIRNTFGEASLPVLFFSMFGIFFGLKFLESRSNFFIILSGISFGLGILTKYNAPFFLLAFLIYAFFYIKLKNEKVFSKKNVKSLLLLLAIVFFFSLPPLVFNYLIYKNIGIMDVYFSRVIQTQNTQALYGGLAGQGNSFFGNLFTLSNYGNFFLPFKTDLIITLFALFGGLLLFLNKKYNLLIFLSLVVGIPFILQSAGAPLPKHFVFLPFLLSILAGYGLYTLTKKINNKKISYVIILTIAIILIFNFGNSFSTPSNFPTPSANSQLKSYLNDHVNQNSFLVFDSRIYTSQSFWLATPNRFLSDVDFAEINDFIAQNQIPAHPVDFFFVECVVDDCGWGTIHNQPNVNQTVESFFTSVKDFSYLDREVIEFTSSGNEFLSDKEEKTIFKVRRQVIASNFEVLSQASSFNSFYFAPYLYQDLSNYVYSYEATGPDKILDKLAYYIIILSILLTFLMFFLVLYFFTSEQEKS